MDETPLHAGARGAHYEDESGEARAMEKGVNALGTPEAGAGPDAAAVETPSAAAQAPRTTPDGKPPVLFASDEGEQTAIERGVQLTEEGQQAARGQGGGEVF